MKICVAQTRPVKGDLESNLEAHKKLVSLAVEYAADMIIFPELSLTGYEPGLAEALATDVNDSRLDELQRLSDTHHISIGAGMPLWNDPGVLISMLLFQPGKQRSTYFKQHLHEDEYPYFVKGRSHVLLPHAKEDIALAICYELSVPEHSANAAKAGAKIYIASVAKTADGVEKAIGALSAIANKYSMTVFLSNCVGHCDNFDCGGRSSVWNDKGVLLAQLDDVSEGILIFDNETKKAITRII